MNWNDAAEDLLHSILSNVPRPVREETGDRVRQVAESLAEEDSKSRVGVETVVAAWIRTTPETLRPDLPRQMESMGLDPADYEYLFD